MQTQTTREHRNKNSDRSTNANDALNLLRDKKINHRRWKTIPNIYYAVTKNASTASFTHCVLHNL